MLKETRIKVAHGDIATLELGDRRSSSVQLVFIHGWLDNAGSFQTLLPLLKERIPNGYFCAIDLPGHGHSSHKPDGHFYPFHDYIDDIHQLLAELSPNKLVLVGHSLGALIASCYSAAFPEQVAGLVQIEGFGPLAEPPQNSVHRLRQGVKSRQRIRRKPVRSLASIEQAIEKRAQVNQLDPQQIAPIVERGIVNREGGWYWRHDSKLQSDSLYRMSAENAKAIIDAITSPQLVILGQQGFEHLSQVEQQVVKPDIDVVTVDGGHHCHLQDNDRVIDLISGLVNKI
ncbi:alpha/beta hydrolase [Vibrio paucivorans]|uniref:Alpha/beta hydrolase n=1 Tax=Vibrio paucivorans TaxID=2829489 RepID=A0A9X3CFZ8_9VIBR|nr:alpha/beta hydrolase [Vibrio paucivorans]MCW8335123.1 alpha/beta hydrolase [Vibrio paucivorans]